MRSRRVRTISTAAWSASAPPDRPVPAPRGTKGMPRAASKRTTATTSSRLPGSTATRGTRRWVGSPSRAYVRRSGRALRTWRAPTISASASTNPASVTWYARSGGGGRRARSPSPAGAPRRGAPRRRRAGRVPRLADGEGVGAPIGGRLGGADRRHATHVPRPGRGRAGRAGRAGRGVGRGIGDPEAPVARETVLDQLTVAGLKDVQRLRRPREQDDGKGKNRKLPRHAE